jgi:hypothetical protein
MTRARDFDFAALGSFRVPPFEVRVDGSVFSRYQHPARFASPRSCGDDCFEIVSGVEHLRSRHESGLLSREGGCEVLMKLGGVEVSETVSCLLYRIGLAEVTWEALSIVRLILSGIRHVGRDVDQSGNRWIRSRFGDYGAAITVSHKNAWSILQSEHALRRGHIFFERCLRLLDDTYLVRCVPDLRADIEELLGVKDGAKSAEILRLTLYPILYILYKRCVPTGFQSRMCRNVFRSAILIECFEQRFATALETMCAPARC